MYIIVNSENVVVDVAYSYEEYIQKMKKAAEEEAA